MRAALVAANTQDYKGELGMLARAFVVLAVVLGCTLTEAQASSVASGNNDTTDGSFQLTTFAPPFLVSNPAGPLEYRAAVKFDFRQFLTLDGEFTDARFVVRGTVETEKDLSAYVFGGVSPDVVAAELDLGQLVGTVHLTPQAGVVEVEFDFLDFLTELDGSYPPFLGFNLRESESAGGIVTIEYLVVGTFLGMGFQLQAVPQPAALVLLGLGCMAVALGRWRRM